MNSEIKSFIQSIYAKTGIEVSLYNYLGKHVFGEKKLGEQLESSIDEVTAITLKQVTAFPLRVKGEKFTAVISGAENEQKIFALLIIEIVDNMQCKDVGLSKLDFIRALTLGEINYAQSVRLLSKFSITDGPVFVMLVDVETKSKQDVQSILKAYMDERSGYVFSAEENQLAIVKFVDEESNAYMSTTEYAQFLVRSVYEEGGVLVRITIGGTVNTALSLNVSYAQAISSIRMGATNGAKGEVHSFKEYVLQKMLEDMPKYKLNECLEVLLEANAKEILEDKDMTDTAEEFLLNNLNVSETSRKLYLHRNTLAYRLDKIEKGTGLNIRKFSDAVTFRLITILSKLAR